MRNRKQKIKYILLLCVFSMFLIASCKRSETGKTVESKEVINAQWENAAHTVWEISRACYLYTGENRWI